MQGTETWALVADGARARILRALDTTQSPAAHETAPDGAEDIVFEVDHHHADELYTDEPGRTFSSTDARRAAKEPPTDPIRLAEQDFAKGLLDRLKDHHQRGEFDRLAVLAAPQTLGDLRQAMPGPLKGALYAEIAKDLTTIPTSDLRTKVIELLREQHTL